MRDSLRRWRSRAWGRVLAAAATAAVALPLAAAADVVNVHDFRDVLWGQSRPRTAEDIVRLKKIGVEWEKVTRKPVLEEVDTWLIENNFNPPVSSGTPPHSAGSSGVFTDIDHSFATFEDAQAAARRFEELGYTVQWNAADTFSVKELDYTGFANTRPRMVPGSAEEVQFLKDATRFPDKLWTRGSQEWVEGAKMKARIDIRNTRKGEIVERLADSSLDAAQRQALQSELDDVERSLAALRDELAAVKVTDRTGFTVDMFKKAAHHMDPSEWCPVPNGFRCWEDPRQAAKAAGRALKEMPGTLSEAQRTRLAWLQDIANGKEVLPGEGAELEALKEKLVAEIDRSMSEAYEASVATDAAFDRALVSDYEAAVASGDAAAISRARVELAKRQLTARRIEATLQGMVEGEGAEASKVVHEWVTGERIRLVERPGKAPVYEVVEETAEGLKVVGTRTAAEVNETALGAVEGASLRTAGKWSHPFGGYEPPSFSSVSPEGMTLAGQVKHGVKNVGPFTLLLAAYGAYVGGKESVEMLDEHTEMRVLSASDFGDWRNITAEKVGGWATATALGTVLAVSELTGVSHVGRAVAGAETTTDKIAAGGYAACQVLIVCMVYELGQWYSGEAIQAELEAAGHEGRPASRARMAANLVGQVPFRRLGERMGKAIAEWGKQRSAEIMEYGGSELAARRSEAASSEVAAQLEAALGANGMDALAEHLTDLRLRTAALEQTWAAGTEALDRAILGRQDLEILREALSPVPDFAARCRALLAELGEDADEAAVAKARADWEKELEAYAEKVRRALEAAVETVGDAVTAANVFGDVGMWEKGLADQGAVQRNLAARFGRLTIALPDNKPLAAWRAEIHSTADPVPIELRPDLAEEARSIAFEAEEAIRELAALLKLEIPACELPEPEEEEETPIAAVPPPDVTGPVTVPPTRGEGEPQPAPPAAPVLKLVKVDWGGARISGVTYEPGSTGYTVSWTNPAGTVETYSNGFVDFPLEIMLGKPFVFGIDLASQKQEPAVTASPEAVARGEAFGHACNAFGVITTEPIVQLGAAAAARTKNFDPVHYGFSTDLRGTTKKFECPPDYNATVTLNQTSHYVLRFVSAGVSGNLYREFAYRVEASGKEMKGESITALQGKSVTITFDAAHMRSNGLRVSIGSAGGSDIGPLALVYGLATPDQPAVHATPFRPPAVAEGGETPGPQEERKLYYVLELRGAGYSISRWTTPATVEHASNLYKHEVISLPADQDADAWLAERHAWYTTYECGGPGARNMLRDGFEAYYWDHLSLSFKEPSPTREEAERVDKSLPQFERNWEVVDRTAEDVIAAFGCGDASRTPAEVAGAPGEGGGGSPRGGTGTGSAGPGGPGTQVAAIPRRPENVDPRQPEVAALIEEYLSVAEPYQNVTEGANFRFDEWGDLSGSSATGAFTTRRAKPDNAGARPPTQFAWDERRRIDSVDHCTMEQYVMAGLQGGPPTGCARRYKGTVTDVAGLTSRQAKTKIEPFRFKVMLRPGEAAPSPELSGTVQRQEPAPGTKLARGESVTLWIRAPYVEQRTVPDLAGLTSRQARARLAEAGLKASVKPGSTASTAEDTGKVEGYEPSAGAKVKPGSEVVVTVFAPFVDQRTVPELVGLSSREAKDRLKEAGLKAKVALGTAAATAADTGKVEGQEPAAGTRVKAGSEVAVTVFTPFVEARTVPDLVNLSFEEARTRLAAAGLAVERRDAGAARARDAANTVAGQEPAAGTRVKPGHRVVLDVRGAYVPSPQEQVTGLDCSNLPHSEAAWDPDRGAAVCRCVAGYEWSASESACRGTRETQIAIAEQICASQFPGSAAVWEEGTGETRCVCPEGQEFDQAGACAPAQTAMLPACPSPERWDPDLGRCVAPDASVARESYFVGLWAYQPAACAGEPPPRRSQGETAGNLGAAIAQGIEEGLEEAIATMGMSLAADGAYSMVNIPTGQTQPVGQWFYRDGVLSFRSAEEGFGNGDARVLERHPDHFVAEDVSQGDRMTLWRCSSTPQAQQGGGVGATTGSGCFALADQMRRQIESRAIRGQEAERQMRVAGCAGELNETCPSGTFGQSEWPDCVGATGYQY